VSTVAGVAAGTAEAADLTRVADELTDLAAEFRH
jgi:hypothetical protein